MTTTAIPEPVKTGVFASLAPYRPGLTPAKLDAALDAVLVADHERELAGQLMTRKEAAATLKISFPTLGRMLDERELERVRVRRRVFVRASDVRAIIEGRGEAKP